MKKANISQLIFDDKNFNKGSEYGNHLINKSFAEFGAGRSILIDRNNKIIAGNKSVENYGALGNEDVLIIESDGTKLIAVKRTDIDLDTPQGREMALADNQTALKNIVIDAEMVEAELSEAVCEEWGVLNENNSGNLVGAVKKENLEPFKKTHILLSFHPQIFYEIQTFLQNIIDIEGVEYEQSSN